ncbi:MAG: DNA methyltransferase [Candidatus Parabeggiatoa sp.]|nr:DNA methyltransferase [Candidatus Parabeggiatoa sp.]
MSEIKSEIHLGDCLEVLATYPDHYFDLIITSPPYADSRANTYGGIKPDDYVAWFLPRSQQLLRVLKPTGTFILNLKEKVVDGERHTYVIELILAFHAKVFARKNFCVKYANKGGFGQKTLFGTKKIVTLANGLIAFEMLGNTVCNLIKSKNSTCIKRP